MIDLEDELTAKGSPIKVAFVGENGSGKSRRLKQLHDSLRVKGVRALLIPADRHIQGNIMERAFQHAPNIDDVVSTTPTVSIDLNFQNLLLQVVLSLASEDTKAYDDFVRATADWLAKKKQPPEPTPPEEKVPPFLNSLGEIIGHKVTIQGGRPAFGRGGPTMSLAVTVDGTEQSINALSDGEKQILLFAIFLLQKPQQELILLVDEPELHLNEARCINLWEKIEDYLPNVSFVYATHSLLFATRPSIRRLYVVERGSADLEVSRAEDIPDATLRRIIGARIQILRTDAFPVFCEDDAQRSLIIDLFQNDQIEPVLAGNWETVRSAVASDAALTGYLLGKVTKCGIIDRDFHSEEKLNGMEGLGVFALPFSESESVILHPNVALPTLSRFGLTLSYDAYAQVLAGAAQKSLPRSMQLLSRQVGQDYPVKISYDHDQHIVRNISFKVDDNAEQYFKNAARQMFKAIEENDTSHILALFKGKDLYRHTRNILKEVHRVDLPEVPAQLYTTMKNLGNLRDHLLSIPELSDLKIKVLKFLASSTSVVVVPNPK
ncbi:ATP-dependent nuclease [Neorhizobium sp. DAR64872/K0K18]|uniref:ATP-dependent nuclease n=1 Tax=Neorhizobium sp. DAR64872/K0K18 TaxID=3421958 RepID=UPI003D2E75BF